MTREPATDLERAALARAREYMERNCWASLKGSTILDVRQAVAVHLRGKAVDGQTVRVEVLLLADGTMEGPRRIGRKAHKRTGALAQEHGQSAVGAR